MAGFVYNPTEFETFPVTVVGKDGKEVAYNLPLVGYLDPGVAERADAKLTERYAEVQKLRDERNEKRLPIIAADATTAYPTNLDWMLWVIEEVEPKLHEQVASWPYRPRTELWNDWQEASKVREEETGDSAEKSEASSNSSDATE